MKIVLRGSTRVVKNHLEEDEEEISSPAVLAMVASKKDELASLYNEDAAFSQYCHDGSELANALASRLKLGGWVELIFDADAEKLFVETCYESTDALSAEEIQFLVVQTIGQWSDGSGGSAMDDFCEFIEPYYVELDEFDPTCVSVTTDE